MECLGSVGEISTIHFLLECTNIMSTDLSVEPQERISSTFESIPTTVELMVSLLQAPCETVRIHAARMLGRMKQNAEIVRPALQTAAMVDRSRMVRQQASQSLPQLQSN